MSGFRHVGIIVKDIDASLHFYKDLLGLELIQDFCDDSDYINEVSGLKNVNAHMIKLKTKDGIIVEILKYLNHPTDFIDHPIYNAGICHIAFQVDSTDKMYIWLKENGVKVISKPILSSEKIAKVFFCFDPNNVRVEIVEMLTQG
jgi:catechol 2,3-dioxygenase-like lactoylglutathione lyase family enzyme